MTKEYKKEYSSVEVTFKDGTIKNLIMTAGPKIASWLMQDAKSTGVLVLRNDDTGEVICIPMDVIYMVNFNSIDVDTSTSEVYVFRTEHI